MKSKTRKQRIAIAGSTRLERDRKIGQRAETQRLINERRKRLQSAANQNAL